MERVFQQAGSRFRRVRQYWSGVGLSIYARRIERRVR